MTYNKITAYLDKLSSHEIVLAGTVIKAILQKTIPPEAENAALILNDQKYSLAYKTLLLYVLRLSRRLCSESMSTVECVTTQGELSRLGAHLNKLRGSASATVVAAKDVTVSSDAGGLAIREGIRMAYSVSVGRYPVEEEIKIWLKNFDDGTSFHEFFLSMNSSDEAKSKSDTGGKGVLLQLNEGEFVQTAYEIVLGRCAKAWEVDLWREKLLNSSMTRSAVLTAIFSSAHQIQAELAKAPPHDGLSCLVMGTGSHVSVKDWEFKARSLAEQGNRGGNNPPCNYQNNFVIKTKPQVLVSALASLYCGGNFIEQFMDNITGQDAFGEWCELIIVDADSPEDEYKTIKKYMGKFKNINYIRCNYRIGIYEAWNVAAKAAKGMYLTNTNMDDLRRHDSLMLQAGVLDNLKFVDVVYQDLFYTFDPRLPFDEIADFGLQTTLPVITPHNMLDYNSPHNAPMWRKSLHDELGYFETRYRSAGDYDFWMRCLAAGKRFYKINDPHVVYYQNPKGLSTRPDTRGLAESCEILKSYGRKLVSNDVVMPREKFIESLRSVSGGHIDDVGDRYQLVQQALQNTSRTTKYKSNKNAGVSR